MSAPMTAAQILLGCLTTELNSRPAPPESIMLRAGAQVTPLLGQLKDECCSGLAWVRVASVSANPRFDSDTDGDCFSHMRVATLELGVVRCAPMSDVTTVPSADAWTASALQLDSDYEAMEAALCCAYEALDAFGDAAPKFDAYEPLGVDGNCIGGTMTVQVEVSCGCSA